MTKHKDKQKTHLQLLVRIGGFVASLPILLFLFGLLLPMVIVLSVVIFLGVPTDPTVADAMPFLLALWIGTVISIVLLLFAVFRYGKGMWRGFERLRGLRAEKSRIDQIMQRLTDEQNTDLNIWDVSTEPVSHQSSRH